MGYLLGMKTTTNTQPASPSTRKLVGPFNRSDDKTLTLAFARYARVHNEYASTVRQNTELRAAAIREWNESR